jgi:hypothetical protein
MVSAAPEPVVAPDLAHVEPEREIVRQIVDIAGEVRDGLSFSPPRLR